jgi:2-dehydropantoate 2-reductase
MAGEPASMKIAVVGCGALGTYYGAKLCSTGAEVHFLLRSDWEAVSLNGVWIQSLDGDLRVNPNAAIVPQEIGTADLVVIGLKTTANDQYEDLMGPLVGPQTAVVTLQNGLGNEARLAGLFGPEKVLGGLCFVCLNRIAPGVVAHLGYGRVVLGEFNGPPLKRTHAIAALFRKGGVPVQVTDNLERARWEKLVWNVPFNGLGVAGTAGYDAVVSGRMPAGKVPRETLPTDVLLRDPQWASLVRELMAEIILVARDRGLNLSASVADTQIARTREMGDYKASTLIDYERGKPLELQSMFLEPLLCAQAAGLSTPRLAALCNLLQKLDPGARR